MSKTFYTLKSILSKGRTLALIMLDQLLMLCQRRGTSGGVVLIRLDNIGDFILWLDTAKVYRQLYPNQKITLVANASWAGLAHELPYWDKIIAVDTRSFKKRWLYHWKLLRLLRSLGFDTAVQPTFSREILVDSLINVTGALDRIGSQGNCSNMRPWQKRIVDQWYTQLVAADCQAKMELERNAEFIRNLSGQTHTIRLPVIPSFAQLPERLSFSQPYCILFPGASWWGRHWPADKFEQVAQTISREQKLGVVICGGPNDKVICAQIARLFGIDAIDLSGQTTLVELIELIRQSKLLISNETSAIHIAAAVGTPSVCILGGGHFGRFMPYLSRVEHAPVAVYQPMSCFGCNWQCTQPHSSGEAVPCVKAVTVEQVCDAIRQQVRPSTMQ